MPNYALRPNLYRMVTMVMSDGATIRVPSAVRMVGNTLQLERDPHNHPVFLVRTRLQQREPWACRGRAPAAAGGLGLVVLAGAHIVASQRWLFA